MALNFRYRKTLDRFTRQSIAHSPVSGRMVGLNIPRYADSKAIDTAKNLGKMLTVEEGTANLLPSGSDNFVIGWQAANDANITVTTGQPDPYGQNKAYRIQSTGGTSVKKYSLTKALSAGTYSTSVWIKAINGSVTIIDTSDSGITVTTTDGWKLVKIQNKSYVSSELFKFHALTVNNSLDFAICYPQVEQKAYCSSYIPPGQTRVAENFTLPLSALTEGTIEFDVNLKSKSGITSLPIIDFSSQNYYIFCDGTMDEICRIALTFDAYTVWCYVNGVNIGGDDRKTFDSTIIVGNCDSSFTNTQFGNFRISNIKRSDSVLANYSEKLAPDSNTILLTNFDERTINTY